MIINCASCNIVIAEHQDPAEAEELAFEVDAHEDREADIWTCDSCLWSYINEMMNKEYAVIEVEANLRAMQDEAQEHGAMTAYLRAKGEI